MELNDSMVSKNRIEPLKEDGEENEGFQAEEDTEEPEDPQEAEDPEEVKNPQEAEDPEEAEDLEEADDQEDEDRDASEDHPDPPDSPLGYLKVAPDPETLSETRSRTWSHAIKKNLKLLTSKSSHRKNTKFSRLSEKSGLREVNKPKIRYPDF